MRALGTATHAAPVSVGFFSGKSPGVCCHFLLQGILLTQRLNPHFLHWQADSLPLSRRGSLALSLRFLAYKRRVIIYFQINKIKLGNEMCEMLSTLSGTRQVLNKS